jgi:UDP:flavonoid glycosyltransferase YjiC (YdhE family)
MAERAPMLDNPSVVEQLQAARFLLVSWDGGGNTNPAYHLGSHLALRGHGVTVLGWPEMAGAAARAGLAFASYPSMTPWPTDVTLDDAWSELVEPRLLGSQAKQDVMDVTAAYQPDVLVIDAMMPAAFEAAAALRIPAVAMVHVQYRPFVDVWGDIMMKTSAREMLAAVDQVLVLTPPGFEDFGPLPANTSHVGAILPPQRAAPPDVVTEPGDPWVLISLSTTLQGQHDALPPILEALEQLPIRALLTLGGAVAVDSIKIPTNVVVSGYVEHNDVLPYMSAVVSHGGLSTITAALSYGVPLLCIAQGRDQSLNAERVEAVGAGRSLPRDASVATIAGALREVLANVQMRRAAAAFAVTDAGVEATDLVERLLRTRITHP